jgi:hypothetical protein
MYYINGLYVNVVSGVNQFLGANPSAGRANGTQVTDTWLNDVQGELIGALTAAGLTPAVSTVQLPAAISKLAVLAAAGNFQSCTVYAVGSATVTAAQSGQVLEISASSAITLTLPTPVAAAGSGFLVWNNSAYAQTLATPANDFLGPGGTSTASFKVAPGQIARIVSDSSNWIVVYLSPLPAGLPFYQDTQSLSTTTGNSSSYTLITRTVTFPVNSPSGGFRVKAHGTLQGGSTAQTQQSFTLSVSDGSVSTNGVSTLLSATAAGNTIGVESSFFLPTVYAPGAVVTFSLKVSTGAGGGLPGQMAMAFAQLDLQVSYA